MVERGFRERRARGNTRVVDQNVHWSQCEPCSSERCLYRCFIGDIHFNCVSGSAQCLQRVASLCQSRAIATHHGEIRALGRECLRNRKPNASRATGDDGVHPVQRVRYVQCVHCSNCFVAASAALKPAVAAAMLRSRSKFR